MTSTPGLFVLIDLTETSDSLVCVGESRTDLNPPPSVVPNPRDWTQ